MKNTEKVGLISVISLIVFALIFLNVYFNGFLVKFDYLVNALVPQTQNSLFVSVANIIGIIFDTSVLIPISIILFVFFWFKLNKRNSLFFLIIMLVDAGLIWIIKNIFQRARPINALIPDKSFSFPSGHVTSSVVFLGALVYLIFREPKHKSRRIFFLVLSVFLILLISLSRLYLNVHWFSDILGGLTLGLFILTAGILLNESSNQ